MNLLQMKVLAKLISKLTRFFLLRQCKIGSSIINMYRWIKTFVLVDFKLS